MTSDLANTRLRAVINKLMKARSASYADVAAALGVSASTVKRTLHHDDLSISRLQQLADFFEMDVFDLLALGRTSAVRGVLLSDEQELYLASHAAPARLYWRLLNGQEAAADEAFLVSMLEGQGLVKRLSSGRIKVVHEWPLGFRLKGPLYVKYTRKLFASFVGRLLDRIDALPSSPAKAPDFNLCMLQFVLTASGYEALRTDVKALVAKHLEESRLQLALGAPADRETITFMFGVEQFDVFAETLGEGANLS